MPSSRNFIPLFLSLLLLSCNASVEERTRITKQDLLKGVFVRAPVRIHLADGSVILSQNGLEVRNDSLFCTAERFDVTRTLHRAGSWSVPVDSVVGVEYVSQKMSGARGIGYTLLALSGTVYAVAGTVVIMKAIFGSCPTFYSVSDSTEVLEAEGFSYSIGAYYEAGDLDRISRKLSDGGVLTMRIANEALETHYIDQVELRSVDHPRGTEAFPDADGSRVLVLRPRAPRSVVNRNGRDVLRDVSKRDDATYQSGEELTLQLLPDGKRDFLECTFEKSSEESALTIVLRGRNSLQNTVLLYDVMMRNQGPLVLNWIRRVNQDPLYAWRLYSWYREHSGIRVLVDDGGEYKLTGQIPDTGPIAWKEVAVQIPVDPKESTVRVRLAFLPDSWEIDWIAAGEGEAAEAGPALSVSVSSNSPGLEAESIDHLLREDDGEYLVTFPGDRIQLKYQVPGSQGFEKTLFLWSKGYYIEWVRGEWIKARDDVTEFDLRDVDGISRRLTQLWLQKQEMMEREFYEWKIPSVD